MQNMKLLDLQTGKYLELGKKGFFYGGDVITCPPIQSFVIKGCDGNILDIYADNIEIYDIRELINDNNIIKDLNGCVLSRTTVSEFEITLKSNNQKFVGVPVGNINDKFNRVVHKTEPQEPLKTLCEKTGAVVYGGRYVLQFEKTGIFIENECYVLYINGVYVKSLVHETVKAFENNEKLAECTPFEEYSKQLRNEPNKFEELMENNL